MPINWHRVMLLRHFSRMGDCSVPRPFGKMMGTVCWFRIESNNWVCHDAIWGAIAFASELTSDIIICSMLTTANVFGPDVRVTILAIVQAGLKKCDQASILLNSLSDHRAPFSWISSLISFSPCVAIQSGPSPQPPWNAFLASLFGDHRPRTPLAGARISVGCTWSARPSPLGAL
jgi:hypothetical protein